MAGIKIDRTFTQESGKDAWLKQAEYIQKNLTDDVIEKAFERLPIEVQDEKSEEIKLFLKERRASLKEVAERYYDYLSGLVILTATDKDDEIRIDIRQDETEITIARIKDGKAQDPYKRRLVSHRETQEIWIYGLDDDDLFFASGDGKNMPKIKIIGGQNNDVYTIDQGRKIKVFDHKSKPNRFDQDSKE